MCSSRSLVLYLSFSLTLSKSDSSESDGIQNYGVLNLNIFRFTVTLHLGLILGEASHSRSREKGHASSEPCGIDNVVALLSHFSFLAHVNPKIGVR